MLRFILLVASSFAGLISLSASAAQPNDCPRIISQSPYITNALTWLKRDQCIVGVSRYDKLKRPHTGGVKDPDTAAIAQLKPDLILASNTSPIDPLEMLVSSPEQFVALSGFASFDDMIEMLRTVARHSKASKGAARIDLLEIALRGRLSGNWGRGKKVLVLSACSGSPYSFGKQHYIGDVFELAGFDVVEDAPKIRHLRPEDPVPNILSQVERTHPDFIVNLNRSDSLACNAELGQLSVPVLHLDGPNFFTPGPVLMDGLLELKQAVGTLP